MKPLAVAVAALVTLAGAVIAIWHEIIEQVELRGGISP